ncbi:MAG: zinc-binding metallopeptidase family protein [Gammaproteobacteria bacterium]
MKRFFCSCGTETFFANNICNACRRELGFDPATLRLMPIYTVGDGQWRPQQSDIEGKRYRTCEHRSDPLNCNWLIDAADDYRQCLSCRLTRVIPMLDRGHNVKRWRSLESSKRIMLYMVLKLGLPIEERRNGRGLAFDFLEDKRSNPDVGLELVYTGHDKGVITMNAAEADEGYIAAAREEMNEAYRTLLGHFRHEIGHYYWDILIKDSRHIEPFRKVFGDERRDYPAALERYYEKGAPEDWQEKYISAYASSHPLEDWAETWAHFLHMQDTLETALEYEMIREESHETGFDFWFSEWVNVSVILNALNRSMGVPDAYPFVLSQGVKHKLRFINRLMSV